MAPGADVRDAHEKGEARKDVGSPDMQRRMILVGGILMATVAPQTGFIPFRAQGPAGTMVSIYGLMMYGARMYNI